MADATSKVRFYNTDGTAELDTLTGAGIISPTNQEVLSTGKVTVTSSQILASNSVPITIIGTPGSNKTIIPVSVVYQFDYQTTPYATNTDLRLELNTASEEFMIIDLTTANSDYYFNDVHNPNLVLELNEPLTLKADTGNPTAGDSDLNIWVLYSIIDLA